RCPPDFLPDPAIREWAQEKYPDVDFDEALDALRDYEWNRPLTDWNAALKSWIRKDVAFRRPRAGGAHVGDADRAAQYGSTLKEFRTARNGVEVAKEILNYGRDRHRPLLRGAHGDERHV